MSHVPSISLNVGDSIAAYRIVKISSGSAVICDTVTAIPVGITQNNAQNSGQAVEVGLYGKLKLEFNETMTAGALFQANAAGQGVPFASLTAGSYAVGICLDTVSATGTIANVLFQPHWKLTNP
jgi:hypothetical protein